MRPDDEWIVVDTETTGLRNPVYPVEIAAQHMRGWKPNGLPFQQLLNFDVPIEPAAERLHGYSREFLRGHGRNPSQVVHELTTYCGDAPIVAYNMAYDWSRVLCPTVSRLERHAQLKPGFCGLNLMRKVAPSLPNFRLQTVIRLFGIAENQDHHASGDVALTSRLFSDAIGPHFSRSGVVGFERVADCARGLLSVPPLEACGAAASEAHPAGPTAESAARAMEDLANAMVAIGELVGICRLIMLDRRISDEELNFLASWLEQCPYAGTEPIAGMFDLVRDVVADGRITDDERKRLAKAMDQVIRWRPRSVVGSRAA